MLALSRGALQLRVRDQTARSSLRAPSPWGSKEPTVDLTNML